MRLSVCLIARNEERNLPRAIASLSGVADEVVVADTGSTDGTVRIATEMGARVLHFPWCDDFSAARNFVDARAQGAWILWMDADEELLPESKAPLLRCTEKEGAFAFFILSRDLCFADRPDYHTEMWKLRLYRRHPDLVFRGRCHPAFHPPAEETAARYGKSVLTSSIVLRHYGYLHDDENMKKRKLRRAAQLLALELEDRPGQLYYIIEYGRTLLKLDDLRATEILAEATRIVLAFRDAPQAPSPMTAALFEYLLQIPEERLPEGMLRAELHSLVRRWFPKAAPLLWIMAQQAFEKGRYPQAEKILRSLLAMGEGKSYDRSISFDPRIVGGEALLNLGICLVRQARLDEAEGCFLRLVKSGSFAEEAKNNLQIIAGLRIQFSS